jgi:enamine deaminase RidA (YjgF/YER057c/UK114 family)
VDEIHPEPEDSRGRRVLRPAGSRCSHSAVYDDGLAGDERRVIRTRLFLTREAEWEGAIRAHHEAFSDVLPANTTLYVAGFIPQGVLVEVEVDAVVSTDE